MKALGQAELVGQLNISALDSRISGPALYFIISLRPDIDSIEQSEKLVH